MATTVPYRQTFFRLLGFLRPYRVSLIVSITLAVGSQAAAIVIAYGTYYGLAEGTEKAILAEGPETVAAVIAEAWGGRARPAQLLAVGPDAHLAAGWQQRRKTLFVLVVGETARAQNFGLGGYSRQTTPELARRDVAPARAVRLPLRRR